MNRRQVLKTFGASVVGLVLTNKVSATGSSKVEVDYAQLDQMPEPPEVESGVTAVVATVNTYFQGEDIRYGCRVRILSKSLAVLNEEHKIGQKLDLDFSHGPGCVSHGINTVVTMIRDMRLDYASSVRILCHALGVISEQHRIGQD
jgi:hypothetical protein